MLEQPLEVIHVQVSLGLFVVCCAYAAWRQRSVFMNVPTSSSQVIADCSSPIEKDKSSARGDSPTNGGGNLTEFHRFQRSYLGVYLLCTFSDWLKGPYVYALYEEYGFSKLQIAWLFVGGFLSSLIFGTFVGSLSDKFGRKRMCLVFCFVYALSALTKPFNSFAMLFFGRVLSGVATSLLFTAFESWMVSEHRSRQFPEHLIANTFSKAILGNGIVAILAGVAAQAAANCCGYVAPFLVAIPCLMLAAFLMHNWSENYGNQHIHVYETLQRGWEAIRREKKLRYLGACQSLFEGAMYTWVFYWTPCLRVSNDDIGNAAIPFGLVFACYMGSLMLGGSLTDAYPPEKSVTPMHCGAIVVTALSALFFENKVFVFAMFTIFEGLVGVYFGAHGTLRSLHIEEATRSSVMNIFRVPLNLFVVTILQVPMTPRHVILVLTIVHILSLISLQKFWGHAKISSSSGGASNDSFAAVKSGGREA